MVAHLIGLLALSLGALAVAAQDGYAPVRERMVADQIESRGVRDVGVLRAMRAVPRHEFVPSPLRALAHRDHPLPIGYDATISQPYIVALMTELLRVSKDDRVLEIGTGSGYQAAVLSGLVSHVYSIEIVPELADSARERLGRLGYKNVTVRCGDGFAGWPEQAPFSRIILTAAPVEIPPQLVAQLAKGGLLVAPRGRVSAQELVVVSKDADGKARSRVVGDVAFVPMVSGKR